MLECSFSKSNHRHRLRREKILPVTKSWRSDRVPSTHLKEPNDVIWYKIKWRWEKDTWSYQHRCWRTEASTWLFSILSLIHIYAEACKNLVFITTVEDVLIPRVNKMTELHGSNMSDVKKCTGVQDVINSPRYWFIRCNLTRDY